MATWRRTSRAGDGRPGAVRHRHRDRPGVGLRGRRHRVSRSRSSRLQAAHLRARLDALGDTRYTGASAWSRPGTHSTASRCIRDRAHRSTRWSTPAPSRPPSWPGGRTELRPWSGCGGSTGASPGAPLRRRERLSPPSGRPGIATAPSRTCCAATASSKRTPSRRGPLLPPVRRQGRRAGPGHHRGHAGGRRPNPVTGVVAASRRTIRHASSRSWPVAGCTTVPASGSSGWACRPRAASRRHRGRAARAARHRRMVATG